MRVYFAASVTSTHAKFTLIDFYKVTKATIKLKNIATPDTRLLKHFFFSFFPSHLLAISSSSDSFLSVYPLVSRYTYTSSV